MTSYLFELPIDRHFQKCCKYLEEARAKRVVHQAAAERHDALTRLYAGRISGIEAHLGPVVPDRSRPGNSERGTHDGVRCALRGREARTCRPSIGQVRTRKEVDPGAPHQLGIAYGF